MRFCQPLWLTQLCIVTLFHILPVLVMLFLPVCVLYMICKVASAGHSVSTEADDTEGSAATFDSQISSNHLLYTSNGPQCKIDHTN